MRPETATLMRELLALLFPGRKVRSEIVRFALQRLDELLVSVEQFRPGGWKAFKPLFAPQNVLSTVDS